MNKRQISIGAASAHAGAAALFNFLVDLATHADERVTEAHGITVERVTVIPDTIRNVSGIYTVDGREYIVSVAAMPLRKRPRHGYAA